MSDDVVSYIQYEVFNGGLCIKIWVRILVPSPNMNLDELFNFSVS